MALTAGGCVIFVASPFSSCVCYVYTPLEGHVEEHLLVLRRPGKKGRSKELEAGKRTPDLDLMLLFTRWHILHTYIIIPAPRRRYSGSDLWSK